MIWLWLGQVSLNVNTCTPRHEMLTLCVSEREYDFKQTQTLKYFKIEKCTFNASNINNDNFYLYCTLH